MRFLRRLLILLLVLPLLLAGAGALLLRNSRGAFGTAFELRPGLAQVAFTGTHSYAYAMRADNKVLLFDTGTDPEGKGIDALLAALNASRNQVEDVFLSHGHHDHLGAATLFPHARVHAGAEDVDLISRKVYPDRWMAAVLSFLAPLPAADVTDPITGAGEIAVAGGKKVRAIPIPGHTPGSYAFLTEGVLFVGDTLALDHGKLGVGPTFFSSDPALQAQSIDRLKNLMRTERLEIVCTGHGGCTRTGEGASMLQRATASVGNLAPL